MSSPNWRERREERNEELADQLALKAQDARQLARAGVVIDAFDRYYPDPDGDLPAEQSRDVTISGCPPDQTK